MPKFVTAGEWLLKEAEIVRDHCQPTNITTLRLKCRKNHNRIDTKCTYNTSSDWGGKFTAGEHDCE